MIHEFSVCFCIVFLFCYSLLGYKYQFASRSLKINKNSCSVKYQILLSKQLQKHFLLSSFLHCCDYACFPPLSPSTKFDDILIRLVLITRLVLPATDFGNVYTSQALLVGCLIKIVLYFSICNAMPSHCPCSVCVAV